MGYSTEMAKVFKNNENPDPVGAILGDVISVNPLKVAIYNNKATLSKEQNNCYICSYLVNSCIKNTNFKFNNIPTHGTVTTDGELTLNILNVGDKVLCVPTANGQKFFIVDKVV
ncbi:DUF2577 family protein [Clostridium butyricum]|uniref:DUF2577 family protein n=1 Tax=Clostridium butyricum TaxID=1492 RepID=UPI002ABD4D03|nr:DUF2577 family protein [Clostridium butyricum]